MRAVDRAAVQVQLAEGAQLGQQQLVQGRQTPAAVQSRSRRQQVTPEQPSRDVGSWFQVIPVLSTNTIPASTARSSHGLRPGYSRRRGGRSGSRGCTRSHSPSGTSCSITHTRLLRT